MSSVVFTRSSRARLGALICSLSLACLAQADIGAQAPPPIAPPVQAIPAPALPRIPLTTGRSTILETPFDVTRIAITNPAIADATVVRQREILIDGKAPGTVTLIVWGGDQRIQYDVVVEQPITPLEQQLQLLFPGEDIHVAVNTDGIVISGRVSNTSVMLRAAEVARATAPKANVVNLLQVVGAIDAQQVMLQVRFAEVNRRAISELGSSFFTGANGYRGWVARGTTQQFPAPEFEDQKLVFSDFLNLFLFNSNYNVGVLIKALSEKGYFQSLAEPNLIAYNGQEASFLAGGEFPIPFSTGGTGGIAIQYREFGVRLNFVPTIAGDLIRLHVRPEVSSLDFTNGILMEGFRIPALTVRRAETEVELRDGQSFAVAGLLDNRAQSDSANVPILSQLPIIGNFFKSKADRQERTELLVLVTPRLVRPLNPDEVPNLPALPGPFLPTGDNIGGQLQGGGGTIDAPRQ